MRNHRITKADFRPCSTCMSRSQAGLYLYTLRLISKQPEPTFARLRYNLGGDRPSQTTRLTLSPLLIQGQGLDARYRKGGISPIGSTEPNGPVSQPPTYPAHPAPNINAKL